MDNISLVTTALEYYDENTEKYKNAFRKAKYIKFISEDNDLTHNSIVYFDKDKKELFRSRYELIGIYNSYTNVWTWAWSITELKKKNTNIIRKVWNYGAELDPDAKYLKTELITSRFAISNLIQTDIHVSVASYLSKIPIVYSHYVNIETTEKPYEENNLVDITKNQSENYSIYYMFLLDDKNIDKNK
jgi:hypothetical protein